MQRAVTALAGHEPDGRGEIFRSTSDEQVARVPIEDHSGVTCEFEHDGSVANGARYAAKPASAQGRRFRERAFRLRIGRCRP
jgi:hypothetical protein